MNNGKKILIKFLPSGKSIRVLSGYNLKDAILDCKIHIDSSCGGVGTCGKCKVRIKTGDFKTTETRFISRKERDNGVVLACMTGIISDSIIEIPEGTVKKGRIAAGRYDSDESKKYTGITKKELSSIEINPWIIKKTIIVEKPSLSYGTSDLFRLKKSLSENIGISNCTVPISVIRKMPECLREKNWEVTVILDKENKSLLDISSGRNINKIYGIAVDIGTTTLVLNLVDLNTGTIISSESEYNPQIRFGEDVISRIVYSNKKNGLEKLREVIIDAINSLIWKLILSADIDPDNVVSIMVSGNSTMMHLFYGVPPKYIREEPYVTVANKFSNSTSVEVGLKHIKNASVFSIAGVASYLGGDITSGVLASGLTETKDLSLFLDLGTNGELVVGNSEWMMGCSCSAGPAFEGGGVKCGIRAVEGAIEKVAISQKDFSTQVGVIGGGKPKGICGSGLIDLIGEMYLKGVIDRKGKFNKDIGNKFLKFIEDEFRYVIVDGKESFNNNDIFISEVDIDNLIRAKAAIYAGVKTLLEEVDLNIGDLDRVYLAGGLGENINIQNAITIGMLPDINYKKYFFLGNTSITGAYLSLLSIDRYKRSLEIANQITYLELSVNMKFMDRYVAGLFLPYTDMKDFPSVQELFYNKNMF